MSYPDADPVDPAHRHVSIATDQSLMHAVRGTRAMTDTIEDNGTAEAGTQRDFLVRLTAKRGIVDPSAADVAEMLLTRDYLDAEYWDVRVTPDPAPLLNDHQLLVTFDERPTAMPEEVAHRVVDRIHSGLPDGGITVESTRAKWSIPMGVEWVDPDAPDPDAIPTIPMPVLPTTGTLARLRGLAEDLGREIVRADLDGAESFANELRTHYEVVAQKFLDLRSNEPF